MGFRATRSSASAMTISARLDLAVFSCSDLLPYNSFAGSCEERNSSCAAISRSRLLIFKSEAFRTNPASAPLVRLAAYSYQPIAASKSSFCSFNAPRRRARSMFAGSAWCSAYVSAICRSSDSPVNRIRLCCSNEIAISLSLIRSR